MARALIAGLALHACTTAERPANAELDARLEAVSPDSAQASAISELLEPGSRITTTADGGWLVCSGGRREVVRVDATGERRFLARPGAGPGEVMARGECHVAGARRVAIVSMPPEPISATIIEDGSAPTVVSIALGDVRQVSADAALIVGVLDPHRVLVTDRRRSLRIGDDDVRRGMLADTASLALVSLPGAASAASALVDLGTVTNHVLLYPDETSPVGLSANPPLFPLDQLVAPAGAGVWIVDQRSGSAKRWCADGNVCATAQLTPSDTVSAGGLDTWQREWLQVHSRAKDSVRTRVETERLPIGTPLFAAAALASPEGALLVERPQLRAGRDSRWLLLDCQGTALATFAIETSITVHAIAGSELVGVREDAFGALWPVRLPLPASAAPLCPDAA